jgi:TM2 domain-containing membrane protein YozV
MTDELVATAPSVNEQANEYIAAPHRPSLPRRSLAVAYILLVLFGVLGIHHFYLGKLTRGLIYLPTVGVLGLGVIVDLVTLPSQTRTINARRAIGIK